MLIEFFTGGDLVTCPSEYTVNHPACDDCTFKFICEEMFEWEQFKLEHNDEFV